MTEINALNVLFTQKTPTKNKVEPLWYWRPPAIDKDVLVPAWDWQHRKLAKTPAADRVTLDVNGAFLAFLSGVELSLSGLVHTGELDKPNHRIPGYYLVDVYRWQDTRIPSPLGNSSMGRRVWVTAPTLELLLQLAGEDAWHKVVVHDSWTSKPERNGKPGTVRLSEWAAWLKELRQNALDSGDETYQADVKKSYGAAINLFLGNTEGADRKSKMRRPDWNRTIWAAHGANTWRKAWRAVEDHGITLLAMEEVDTLTLPRADFEHLVELEDTAPQPPMRFDLTGRRLGAFKITPRRADRQAAR